MNLEKEFMNFDIYGNEDYLLKRQRPCHHTDIVKKTMGICCGQSSQCSQLATTQMNGFPMCLYCKHFYEIKRIQNES